jgi:hypothetical protein
MSKTVYEDMGDVHNNLVSKPHRMRSLFFSMAQQLFLGA